MCFPYLFRAALDTRATQINEEMKMAAAKAIADLAKQPVSEALKNEFPDTDFTYGPDHIIPIPFNPDLIKVIPTAVAKAAMESGVATHQITDCAAYAQHCLDMTK